MALSSCSASDATVSFFNSTGSAFPTCGAFPLISSTVRFAGSAGCGLATIFGSQSYVRVEDSTCTAGASPVLLQALHSDRACSNQSYFSPLLLGTCLPRNFQGVYAATASYDATSATASITMFGDPANCTNVYASFSGVPLTGACTLATSSIFGTLATRVRDAGAYTPPPPPPPFAPVSCRPASLPAPGVAPLGCFSGSVGGSSTSAPSLGQVPSEAVYCVSYTFTCSASASGPPAPGSPKTRRFAFSPLPRLPRRGSSFPLPMLRHTKTRTCAAQMRATALPPLMHAWHPTLLTRFPTRPPPPLPPRSP